jgi:hypothetical protein
LRLDACRGLALWFIFIDHIPGNAFDWLTLRNYGFSDATEVFVFVSGYTCMLAYGGALREQGWQTIMTRSLRRGFEIYAAFLLLVIVAFDPQCRGRARRVVYALSDGADLRLESAGLADR